MVIFINQIRMKIGVMYGSPETTTGGNALKFYASVRLDIRRIGAIKDREEVTGNQTRVKVVKNKVAPPFKQVEFDIMYGEGISKMGELVDLGVKAGVVEKSGAWFSFDSQRLGQGRENAKAFLKRQSGSGGANRTDHPRKLRPDRRKILDNVDPTAATTSDRLRATAFPALSVAPRTRHSRRQARSSRKCCRRMRRHPRVQDNALSLGLSTGTCAPPLDRAACPANSALIGSSGRPQGRGLECNP